MAEPSMEVAAVDNSNSLMQSSSDADHPSEDMVPQLSNHEDMDPKNDINADELRSIMEVIATTGKFWHDWDKLKSMLSFWLKQVLAEYPESHTVCADGSQQRSLSGETYPELVKRLDEALLSFIEGPPFTLQRLCEILLDPKSTYRSLSKLALAMEKNLLVTSTLIMSTDPYPTTSVHKAEEPDKLSEKPQGPSDSVPNGVESTVDDGDEEMVEAEVEEDAMNTDTEMREEKAMEAPAINSEPSLDSVPLQDESPVTGE